LRPKRAIRRLKYDYNKKSGLAKWLTCFFYCYDSTAVGHI
jgi:hypothetical protein